MGLGQWMRGLIPGRYPEWYRERRSWEQGEDARTTVRKLRALVNERKRAVESSGGADGLALLAAAEEELQCAERILTFDHHHRAPLGSHVTAAQVHLNMARLLWLKSFLSAPAEVAPYLPGMLAVVREHLTRDDPRRVATEIVMAKSARRRVIDETELLIVLEAVDVAHGVALREKLRAGSFVRIVWRVALFLFLLAGAVGVLTSLFPESVPLCFNPHGRTTRPPRIRRSTTWSSVPREARTFRIHRTRPELRRRFGMGRLSRRRIHRPRRRRSGGGVHSAENQGYVDALFRADRPGGSEDPRRCPYGRIGPPAHAGWLRTRSHLAGLVGADHRVGCHLRILPATLHQMGRPSGAEGPEFGTWPPGSPGFLRSHRRSCHGISARGRNGKDPFS